MLSTGSTYPIPVNTEFERPRMPDASCTVTFAPQVGARVLIQPLGTQAKYKTYFIGLEEGHYLVTSLAPMAGEISQVAKVLPRTRQARLFCLDHGVMNAYLVRVLSFMTSPFLHLYLTYPERNEALNLRCHDRVDCHLPAQVILGPALVQGMVVNLSKGGCALLVDPKAVPTSGSLPEEAQGMSAIIRMQPNSEPDPILAACQVVKDMPDKSGLRRLGLRFLDFELDGAAILERFITFVMEHRV